MLLLVVLFAAADLKDWGSSPQAYFMTKAERAQWAAITNDADAQQFIDRFIASKGPDFVAEVAARAAMADKYLTLGKTPGSKSLRGKVVILLGPPKDVRVADTEVKGSSSSTANGYTSAAADGGPSVANMGAASDRGGMSGKLVRDYTFTYPEFKVTVEADMTSGEDRIPDKKEAAALEKLFESAAAAPVAVTRPKQ